MSWLGQRVLLLSPVARSRSRYLEPQGEATRSIEVYESDSAEVLAREDFENGASVM